MVFVKSYLESALKFLFGASTMSSLQVGWQAALGSTCMDALLTTCMGALGWPTETIQIGDRSFSVIRQARRCPSDRYRYFTAGRPVQDASWKGLGHAACRSLFIQIY